MPVQDGEHRCSFTQYTAGGLFQWVECGFQSLRSLREAGGLLKLKGWERWKEGIDRFSRLDELLSRV